MTAASTARSSSSSTGPGDITSACDQAYEGPHIKIYALAEGDETFQPVALYVTAEDKAVQIPGTNVFVPYQEFEGTKIIEFMVA